MQATTRTLSSFQLFTVMIIAFVWLFEASAIGPALGAIAQAFPNATEFQIRNVMTAPFFTSIIASVAAGWLAARIDKKWLLIAGLGIYGVTGMAPAFATSVEQIIVLRLLTGFGVGLVLPITNMYLSEYYEGPRRERLLGMASVIANLANVVNGIVIGYLQALSWTYPFFSFGIVLVIMVFAIVGAPRRTVAPAATDKDASREPLSGAVWGYAAGMTALWMLFAVITTNCALFMITENIGEPWMIGFATSFPAVGSIVVGAIFPELRRVFGRALVATGLFVFGAGFFWLFQTASVSGIIFGSFLVGIGQGAIVPYLFEKTAEAVNSDRQKDIAFGIVTGCIHFGLVLSPFMQEAFLWVNDAIGFVGGSNFRVLFWVTGVVLILTMIASGFGAMGKRA